MKLNYSDQGSGKTVILLHGMFGSLSNLGHLARALSTDFRVICVDLRNHGHSPHEHQMDLAVMAADIVELMDDLVLPQAYLVGHSLGGKVAMQVAMNFSHRVSSLVVADIAPADYPQKNTNSVVEALQALSSASIESRQSADKQLAAYVDDAPTRAFILKNLQRNDVGQYKFMLNVDAIVAQYATTLVAAPTGQPFAGATLFIKGETSAYIQDKHRPAIQALFTASQLRVITAAGHWLHVEKPDEFNNLIIDFLNGNL